MWRANEPVRHRDSTVAGRGEVVPFAARRRRDPAAAKVVRLVAEARDVPALLLLHPSRCDAPVAEARQLAMYLMHVVLQRNYADVGQFFRRDRTTVAHACGIIEDRREAPLFEAEVLRLEQALGAETEEKRHAQA
jgi:hypothetical protein